MNEGKKNTRSKEKQRRDEIKTKKEGTEGKKKEGKKETNKQTNKQTKETGTENLIFVVPSIMLYSSEISPTRYNNCVFILRNGFTLHVSGDSLTHHQEYICCIWP